MRQQFECKRRRDLVRNVGDADVEVGEIAFENVSLNDIQSIGVRSSLKTASKLEHHARIELDGDDGFSGFEKLLREVSGTRTNLEYGVGGFYAGFLDN